MLDQAVKDFIKRHKGARPEELALMASKRPDLPMAFIAQQVKGRQRIQKKLPSWFAEENAVFPKSIALEQCTSEAVARFRASLVEPGEQALDLTGGFGVDARFLAERFSAYRYVERNEELAEIAAANFAAFGVDRNISTSVGDGREALSGFEGRADLIFVDPARRDQRSFRMSALEDCEPDVVGLWPTLLEKGRRVMLKTSPGLDLQAGLVQLGSVESVYVISVENECKECLFVAAAGHQEESRIHCVNIRKSGAVDRLQFTFSGERKLESTLGIPNRFLYEPNASIMKAGAFKTVCQLWPVRALNPRTRLYCSDELVEDFPGRVFEIEGRGTLTAKDAKRLFPKRKAHVISRNSGMDAVELRKKLALKEGGNLFAIGAAVSDVGRQLFACRLIHA